MSKLLCITSGLTGITNASLEVVRRLQNQGHEVDYASVKDVSKTVKDLGVDFFQLDEIPVDSGPMVPLKGRIVRFLYKQIFSRSRKRQTLVKMEPHKFYDLLGKKHYDLLIIDMELHEFIITGYGMGYKILLLSQWFSTWRIKGLPYIMTDVVPTSGFDFEQHWNRIEKDRRKIFFRRRLQSGGTDRYSILPLFAREKKFPAHFIGDNYWPGPFLYEELPVVSMTAFELEFPHQARKGMHYVGPMVYENRREVVDPVLRARIVEAKLRSQKILYCSLSTLKPGDLSFIERLIKAFEPIENALLLVSLGGKLKNSDLKINSDDVMVMDRMPQIYVLRHADASINHGGVHTINECIHFSVPMLVYSGKKSDQNGCAARVQFHEIGRVGDKDKDDVKMISSKITDILTQRIYFDNIRRLSHQCQRYLEDKTMEGIVREYLLENEA